MKMTQACSAFHFHLLLALLLGGIAVLDGVVLQGLMCWFWSDFELHCVHEGWNFVPNALGFSQELEQAMLRFFGPASLQNTHGQAQASLDGGDVTAVFVRCEATASVVEKDELTVHIPHDVGVSRWLCRVKVWALWSTRRALWSSRRSSFGARRRYAAPW